MVALFFGVTIVFIIGNRSLEAALKTKNDLGTDWFKHL